MADTHRLPLPIVDNWDWQASAACRGMDCEVFFHPSMERARGRRRQRSPGSGRPGMSARAYRPQPMRTTSPATRRARRWPVTFDTERPTSPAMSQACRGLVPADAAGDLARLVLDLAKGH